MWPGPGAEIIRNEAGEVLGWDNPSYDDPSEPYDGYYDEEPYDGEFDEDDLELEDDE